MFSICPGIRKNIHSGIPSAYWAQGILPLLFSVLSMLSDKSLLTPIM